MKKNKISKKIKKQDQAPKVRNEAEIALPSLPKTVAVTVPSIEVPNVEVPTLMAPTPKVETPKKPAVRVNMNDDDSYILVDIYFGTNSETGETLRSGTRIYYKWLNRKNKKVILQKSNLDFTLQIGDEVTAVEMGTHNGQPTIVKTNLLAKKVIDLGISSLPNIEEQEGMTLLFPNELAIMALEKKELPKLKGWVGTKIGY